MFGDLHLRLAERLALLIDEASQAATTPRLVLALMSRGHSS
ncbi:hypothetical protein [Parafrankia soli]|nr:hypothetical protein [Parafrankia soli]